MKLFKVLSLCLLISLLSCKGTDKLSEEQKPIPDSFKGKVMVTLLKAETPRSLEVDFAKYALKHKAVASKSQNRHMFTYNQEAIEYKTLIKKLNKSKRVYIAEALIEQIASPKMTKSAPKKRVQVK